MEKKQIRTLVESDMVDRWLGRLTKCLHAMVMVERKEKRGNPDEHPGDGWQITFIATSDADRDGFNSLASVWVAHAGAIESLRSINFAVA